MPDHIRGLRFPGRVPRGPLWALLCAGAIAGCARELPTAPGPTSLRAAAPATVGSTEDEVLVTLSAATDPYGLAADYGATVLELEQVADWVCAELAPAADQTPAGLATQLALDPRVFTAERNGWVESAESRQQSFAFDDGGGSPRMVAEQPMLATVGFPTAHRVGRGEGVRVAILDTGADLAHPMLAGRVVGGWDFVDRDADPTDSPDGLDNDGDGHVDEAYGHGTHVAALVALAAPRAGLLLVRVLDADGRGDLTAVAAGIRWAAAHGARVVNLSLGALRSSDAVQYALESAEDAGVVAVAAAGNWGADKPEEYPAKSSHALAVAAVDALSRPASFSSYGSFVAVSAPGVEVRSAYPGGRYALWSGTSMAAPLVAGTVALLLALHPDWNLETIEERLAAAARPVQTPDRNLASRFGSGVVDAAAALALDVSNGEVGEPLKRR